MDVNKAVELAKRYVANIFDGEQITNVGLEEVKFNHVSNCWQITIGFSRPWDYPKNLLEAEQPEKRTYKVVNINDENSVILSVENREIAGVQ